MPEKLADNMRDAYESELASVEMYLATNPEDDPRREGWMERVAALRSILEVEKPRVAAKRSGARKKAEKRPAEAPEKRG